MIGVLEVDGEVDGDSDGEVDGILVGDLEGGMLEDVLGLLGGELVGARRRAGWRDYGGCTPQGPYGCFYGCFWVIEAHGGTWFRTPCPIIVRSRSKCQRQRPDPAKRVGLGLRS